jgi:uncharacterized protein (TIGR00661 family)
MKIIYGVQATGNGHISRSREVVQELKALGHQVRVLISGREPTPFWDIDIFKPYETLRGLTFISHRGRLRYIQTALSLKLFRFYKDINSFNADGYDLVITDFEPISARIARRHHITSIGLGHQYAFYYGIPLKGANPVSLWVLKNFAPVDHAVGLHWHHFDQPILPPIVPLRINDFQNVIENKVIVYLPFEQSDDILSLLAPFDSHDFYVYHRFDRAEHRGHIHLMPYSRNGFLQDLDECNGVISNAGFELLSEAIHFGKKLLVKPLAGQMEQLSNGLAISKLNHGKVMKKLDRDCLADYLQDTSIAPVRYPHVARLVARWVEGGNWEDIQGLAQTTWNQVQHKPGITPG